MLAPLQKVFLTARWDDLAMINFEVDPAILLPYLPAYTELDMFNNKMLVSVVGFVFNQAKVFGLRWPYHTSFEEVNLRFYVRRFDGAEWKRGVVFVSEIVPRPVIAYMANILYREPYRPLPMRHTKSITNEDLAINYQWKHGGRWQSMFLKAENKLHSIIAGSEEEFIFDHYWGYNKYDSTTTIEYGVEHSQWQVHRVKDWKLDCNVAALYGDAFVPYLSANPSSVFLAKGSEVIIRKPRFLKG